MNIMLADIEAESLTGAVRALNGTGPGSRGVICDVADPANVDDAAKATYGTFGTVHIVCNNAGVGGGGGIDAISLDTWRWVLDVNLMGVLHGLSKSARGPRINRRSVWSCPCWGKATQPSAIPCGSISGHTPMRMMILAAIAALGLGMASVHAETTPHNPASSHHWGDGQNFMGGGGG